MNAREMKKIIQYEALGQLKQKLLKDEKYYEDFGIGEMIDRDKASSAQVKRFRKVLDEMLESAYLNYPIEDVEFDFGG